VLQEIYSTAYMHQITCDQWKTKQKHISSILQFFALDTRIELLKYAFIVATSVVMGLESWRKAQSCTFTTDSSKFRREIMRAQNGVIQRHILYFWEKIFKQLPPPIATPLYGTHSLSHSSWLHQLSIHSEPLIRSLHTMLYKCALIDWLTQCVIGKPSIEHTGKR